MQLRRWGRSRRAAAIACAVVAGALGAGAPGAVAVPPPRGAAAIPPPRGAAEVPTSPDAATVPSPPEAPSAAETAPPEAPPAVPPGDRPAESSLPAVRPLPQSMQPRGPAATITDDVTLAAPVGTDPYALRALRALLRKAGVRRITEVRDGAALPAGRGLVIRAGEEAARTSARPGAAHPRGGSADVENTLRALGVAAERGELPAGGYRLAVGRVGGRDTVAISGTGDDGLFHGVQTLRQLMWGSPLLVGVPPARAEPRRSRELGGGRRIAGAVVRDWPGTAVRGMTEGFYGTPWTTRQRLAQLDFMGRTKQNRYLYAPGDDPYRQTRWREAYPPEQRAGFRALAERARRNHVTLAWAVAPGQAMCLSSDRDLKALIRKVDAMWALGVHAFQLQFQDVSYSEWHCAQDAAVFGSGPGAAAKAHARVANAVARHLAKRHPRSAPLSLMPTEYYEDGPTIYRTALSGALDEGVEVAWTGVGVVPRTITGPELASARRAFGSRHPLVTMDNYPVNDYAQDRIFLGPYTGREPAVATGSAALLANAMAQPAASRLPLFTVADYAWNPRDYRPQESWLAAVDDLAGDDERTRAALRALAGNNASSVLGADESAYLRPLIEEFWQARTVQDAARNEAAAQRLRAAFTVMRQVPGRLSGTALSREVRPWIEQLARYGAAGETAVDMLVAQSRGDGGAAWRGARELARLDGGREPGLLGGAATADRVTVGRGVLAPFLRRAEQAYARWSGLSQESAAAKDSPQDRAVGGRTVRFSRVRPLTAVTAMTAPGTPGTVEAHIPDQGWRPIGELAAGGWTELAPSGLRADALRITGPAARGATSLRRRGGVDHLVPWFADSPAADAKLTRETDVVIGGGIRRLSLRLTPRRPADVRGKVTVRAPKGVIVRVPPETTLPRGTTVTVPLHVTVPEGTPAGTYPVRVTFGNATRTLVVRACPPTGGPDLARGAAASSSGDETADFPASAAIDGDPETRWSSPAEDGAWWQLQLPSPVRLGALVLHWQDAYASAYRIQVSPDGRTWHTASAVRDGHGGRETVRLDAPGTRFVRVQGDKRATRFGYSLWSVEAYAVVQ
ncbi:beta-N-acetylglucosaminidase domain-containing protein [Streptomyces sp. NPDC002896]|uniref:beta-N-acetylglucosaminidase domain-containing protein n=1 Tax=Streptomyces sp. NPDC002896 TaxID=3154438 RepID=UPI003324B228